MDVDYYSLLTKAVAGKDAVARNKIYKDAYNLDRQVRPLAAGRFISCRRTWKTLSGG